MIDWSIIGIVAVIVIAAAVYVYKEKKKGKRCVGCPCAGACRENRCSCTAALQEEE